MENREEVFIVLTKLQLILQELHDNENVLNVIKACSSRMRFNDFRLAMHELENTIRHVEGRLTELSCNSKRNKL
jgi:hypothetical protein